MKKNHSYWIKRKKNATLLFNGAWFLVAFLGVSYLLSSCSSEPEVTTLDLNFTLTYDDNPLVAFEELNYPLGFKVFFSKYSLFLSNITLHSAEGPYKLSDVEFLDLLTGVDDFNKAQEGKHLKFENVPTGTYTSISFNIGLPSDINATAPADYAANNPLSNNGEYWVGWSSYIFHKIEGKMDVDGDNTPEAGIALHIGSDQAFRTATINTSMDLKSEQESLNINFNLDHILNIDGSYFDFKETPQIHHLGVLPKALPILDNTVKNITVREK